MKANERPVNYIQHLTGIFELFAQDKRLSAYHVSLYMALFQFWNLKRFQNPISISRNEAMEISKIGSGNTYSKCLKELDKFGYIQYLPSFNPLKGSLINLFTFDKGTNIGTGITTDKGREILVSTSINNSKQKKHKNNETKQVVPPDFKEVKNYFLEKENTTTEAERFFNYFESNGWLVGGKTKMKDWKAAARNWMLRSKEFQKEKQPANPLSTNQNKDYSIPL